MKLQKVTIERFKAAFKCKPIEIKDFNVIIGRNGSGKSTLVESLQWIDTTIRRDAIEACKRYFGVHDLLNLRSQASPAYFEIKTVWHADDGADWKYDVKVEEDTDEQTPIIANELLYTTKSRNKIYEIEGSESSDRLSLSRPVGVASLSLREFWRNAVFLRLSPAGLAQGSLARRSTADPLLDEEGKNLPALINELNDEQRKELVRLVTSVLNDIEGISVSGEAKKRNENVHYSLRERMPYRGRSGQSLFSIPAWMLSEGTRRITAIFALLVHEPAPTLLCLEELENGLDPWSVIKVLQHLQSAAATGGTQVVITTHSPWVLDHVPLDSIIYVHHQGGSTAYSKFIDLPNVANYAADIPAGTRYALEGFAGPTKPTKKKSK